MPEDTENQVADGYDFDALRFSPESSKVVCLKTQKEIFLRRNLNDFLFLLLKKPRETVEYQEFRDNVPAWTIYKDVAQVIRTIHTTKGELVRNLRLLREDFDLIEAVPAKGYRLSADVFKFIAPGDDSKTVSEKADTNFVEIEETNGLRKTFGGHFGQAFFASAIYAGLYVIALFIEVSYRYDSFRDLAFNLSAPVFLWILVTSLVGLFGGWRLTGYSAFSGFFAASGIFLSAAFLLHLLLGAFLPAYPVTEANFQTLSAHAAYLKSIFYFLGLGIFLIVLPFVIVVRLETDVAKNNRKVISDLRRIRHQRLSVSNALWLSPFFLSGLTVIALLSSLLMTAHLFENLKPNAHINLFMQLVLWRWFLYFALAAECLIWYWTSLQRLKARSAEITLISSRPAK